MGEVESMKRWCERCSATVHRLDGKWWCNFCQRFVKSKNPEKRKR